MRKRIPVLEPADMTLYRAALRTNGLTRAQAKRLFDGQMGNPAEHGVDAALERLCAIGLLRISETDGERLRPVSPVAVEASLVSALLDETRRAAAEIDRLQRELAPMAAAYHRERGADSRALTVHRGTESVEAAVEGAAAVARVEALTFHPSGRRSQETLGRALSKALAELPVGVPLRMIVQHGAGGSAEARERVRDGRRREAEIRTLDDGFPPVIVFDRATAFIRDGEDAAVEIRFPALLDVLTGMFDDAWLRARPLRDRGRSAAPGTTPDELELAILRHLVAGDTDAKTAQQLGISVRRCQAYIARIAARLGSRSRAQLGYLVAQSGLLQPPPHSPGGPPGRSRAV
jgi:DNA-binding CsgD family transcriptional regulator